jgi:hypothetical protein
MGNFDKALEEDLQNQPVMAAIPPERPVTVFDLGPQLPTDVPKQPDHTATPAAWEDYEEDTARYLAQILRYRRERGEWVQKYGGDPVKLELDHPTSAREFLARDSRYVTEPPPGLMHARRVRA